MTIEIVYFANPMCSWCYGFHAGFAQALRAREEEVALTLALGALREDTEPMDGAQRRYLRDTWKRVAEMSGAAFDPAILDQPDFVYDTRPASRAVAAVRAAEPAHALDYLGAVHLAFYRDGRDVTAPSVLVEVAKEARLEPEVVRDALADPATHEQLAAENAQTASLGVSGYPTVLALTRPKPAVVALGFKPADDVAAALDGALEVARAA